MTPFIETGDIRNPLNVGLLPGENELALPKEISGKIREVSAQIAASDNSDASHALNELAIGLLRRAIGLPADYSELLKNAVAKGNKLRIGFKATMAHPGSPGHDYTTSQYRVMSLRAGGK